MRPYRVPRPKKGKIRLIQGGMGIWISTSKLAQAVSMSDDRALGVVSGVALREVFLRLLQLGNKEMRHAMRFFPGNKEIVKYVLAKYYFPEGTFRGKFLPSIDYSEKDSKRRQQIDVLAAFCACWLAEHPGNGQFVEVGINLLTKVELDILSHIYGAMLAGVSYLFMGAGIPSQIPAILRKLERHEKVEYRLTVEDAQEGESFTYSFDPSIVWEGDQKKRKIHRPLFYAIVASNTLAKKLQEDGADGLIFEHETAGGHNAPPRRGDTYSEKDKIDWEKVKREIHIPYFIAAHIDLADLESCRQKVLETGAQGIQAGSLLALSDKSGMRDDLRSLALKLAYEDELVVRKDMRFSSSGYPFMIAEMPETLSEKGVFDERCLECNKICNKYYLQINYRKEDGTLGRRCSGGPTKAFILLGGDENKIDGTGCLCNALLAAAGLGDPGEPPVVTLGEKLGFVKKLIDNPKGTYTTERAVKYALQGVEVLS